MSQGHTKNILCGFIKLHSKINPGWPPNAHCTLQGLLLKQRYSSHTGHHWPSLAGMQTSNLQTAPFTVDTSQCTLHSAHFTVHTPECTLYSANSTVHTSHSQLTLHTPDRANFALHIGLCVTVQLLLYCYCTVAGVERSPLVQQPWNCC